MTLAFENFEELQAALPRVANVLNTDVEQLKVAEIWAVSRAHMGTQYADRPIQTIGLTTELPFISNGPLHKRREPGTGIVLYQCYGNPKLKYVHYSSKNKQGWESDYFVCKKGELGKIALNARKLARKLGKETPPVLEEGLMDDIIRNTIYFLMNSKLIEKYGVRIRRGILLDGPPGNGKTMACRYIQKLCNEKNIRWDTVTASAIDGAYGEGTLDELFSRATVTFFDDIDISFLNRSHGHGKMACSILSAMDGLKESDHVIRIFTTNEQVGDLDDAFMRPGRIDHRFVFGKPDRVLRRELVESWPDEILDNINMETLLENTDENSFAELEAIRGNLVTNFLFGDKTWNLGKALEEFYNGAGSFGNAKTNKKNPLGFGRSGEIDKVNPEKKVVAPAVAEASDK
jgi:hypothetical protein